MMSKPRQIAASLLVMAGAGVLASCGGPSEVDAEHYPEQDIEILVGFGPGGGADILSRLIGGLIEERTDVNVQVVNMEGAGGANALRAIEGRGDDGYTWVLDTSLAPLSAQGEFGEEGHNMLKPVARFEDEVFHFMTAPDVYESWDDFAEAGEEGTLRVGGVGAGMAPDVITQEVNAESDLDIEYVPFDGAGELIAAVQGNNIDAALQHYATVVDYVESGDLHSILALSDEPLEGFEDVPLSVDVGIDTTLGNTRGIMVHPDTEEEIVVAIEELLHDVYNSDEYQQHQEDLALDVREGWMGHEEYEDFIEEYSTNVQETLESIE